MSDLIRPKRSLLTGVAPAAVTAAQYGELSANLSDKKMWMAGDTGAQVLMGQKIEDYSATRKYAVGDLAIEAKVLYRCITAVDPVGVFDPAKWEAIGGGSAGAETPIGYAFVRRVWFLTIGTFTYDVPAGVEAVRFNVHAPGGPGGGVPAMSSNSGAGAGGSGGGFSQKWVDDPTQLAKQFTFVLPDGAAGVVGANGPLSPNATLKNTAIPGGTIDLNVSGGNSNGGASLMNPGTAPNSVIGGICGVPTGGDINLAGEPGEPGYRGGAAEIMAGRGGGAVFGGAPGFAHKGNAVGKDGGLGAGGSGAASTVSAFAGGKGGQAFAWVDEFVSLSTGLGSNHEHQASAIIVTPNVDLLATDAQAALYELQAEIKLMQTAAAVAFSAWRNGAQNLNDAQWTNLVIDTIDFDLGGYVDLPQWRYTPPAGTYFFYGGALSNDGAINGLMVGSIAKNGGQGHTIYNRFGGGSAVQGVSAHCHQVYQANGTDYFQFQMFQNSGQVMTLLVGTPAYCYFGGYRINGLSPVQMPYTILTNRVAGVLPADKVLLDVNVSEAVKLPDGLPGSIIVGLTPSAVQKDYNIVIGNTVMAQIRVAAGQSIGRGVAGAGELNIPAETRLRVVGPTVPDAAFADVTVAMKLFR